MYAIVEIAGLQYKVSRKQRVFVHRLEANAGDSVELGKVLLIDNDGKITVGTPVIDGARIAAKVISHLQGDKVFAVLHKPAGSRGSRRWLGLCVRILSQGSCRRRKETQKRPAVER